MKPQNNQPIIKTILIDFGGVLNKGYFYSSLADTHPDIYEYIQGYIFRGPHNLPEKWMRNHLTSDDINRLIAKERDISFEAISKIFEDDVRKMTIEQRLLDFAKQQAHLGRRMAIVSDNMDVLTSITVPHHGLDDYFEIIVNSADHGVLKQDENGRLFDIAIEKLNESDHNTTLLIDDLPENIELFENKGGKGYLYKEFEEFERWVKKNL